MPALVGEIARSPERAASVRRGAVDLQRVCGRAFAERCAGRGSFDRALKRGADVIFATSLLVLSLPLLILAALAIWLESPGPILYRQTRIGAHGAPFQILKFRSMREDAEADGARWAEIDDRRVTRVGRVIRRFRIDEIPQAVNVLAGEMSFVGPRPERPEFVDLLRREIPNYDLRHLVKPGLTGWAQVKCAYGASVADARRKLQYDLYYLQHDGPMLDLKVALMTVRVVLFGLGAR